MRMGFAEGLFILFLGLKLIGYVDWSWWWITAPLWVSLLITFPIAVGGALAGRRAQRGWTSIR